MNADRVVDFVNNSTKHELSFLLTILSRDILIWDGNRLMNAVGCNLNGTCFQIATEESEE